MEKQEELMLTRRQKTLSSISNYTQVQVILNQPTGVTFSVTVSKSFTIEQLARQIEAEYAFLVEREIGDSRYPVIECGALFDHIHLKRKVKKSRNSTTKKMIDAGNTRDLRDDSESDSSNQDDEDEDEEQVIDERTETESRGVQLRFSDKVEDVLDRNSIVHVVNIDQGLGMGRKLSLTNLALAVGQENVISDNNSSSPDIQSSSSTFPHCNTSTATTTTTTTTTTPAVLSAAHTSELLSVPHHPIRKSESDILSVHSSVIGTVATSPAQSPHTSGTNSPRTDTDTHPFSHSSIAVEPEVASSNISHHHPDSSRGEVILQDANPRASTLTTDTASTLLPSPFVSSVSLSSILLGDRGAIQSATRTSLAGTAAATTAESWRPLSMCSVATENTTTTTTTNHMSCNGGHGHGKSYSSRPRSRATDILLNLESSSNDARFQEILHNTIALDHFRQFCFQEYSIENLLFWMDVELFSKPSPEFLEIGGRAMREYNLRKKSVLSEGEEEEGKETEDQNQNQNQNENENENEKTYEKDVEYKKSNEFDDEMNEKSYGDEDEVSESDLLQFAIQHARYIYLTYIDSCGPLQVNLSEESRMEIPWPISDHNNNGQTPVSPSIASSSITEKKTCSLWGIGGVANEPRKPEAVSGWPLDRQMFDGAQEHTYQLMKGHTLVRFEDSDLWKQVQRIKREQPEEYANAMVKGHFNILHRPDPSVILTTVNRSRSRYPSARPATLYNWNNSTTDLDRSKDKEEALAKTMSQYFGPIPPSIRHKGRVILGLGQPDDEFDDSCEDYDSYDNGRHGLFGFGNSSSSSANKRWSSSTAGKKNRFVKHLSGGIASRIGRGLTHSGEDLLDFDHEETQELDRSEIESGKRTTRWMVAGYFNDKVRLTAAQRKRLLRRNNKLTKFFGSRVDGTLRPVEELIEGGLGFGQYGTTGIAGSSSAPALGSPLAYALSSSVIHDMEHKSKGKKKKSTLCNGGNSNEVLLLQSGNGSGSRSSNLLQKFKKNSLDYEETGYRAINSTLALSDNSRSPGGQSRGGFFSYKRTSNDGKQRRGRHHRSMTTEIQQTKCTVAHPHPLWGGSLSDQEGVAPSTYERRRGISIMSIMGGSTPVAMPTTPTSTFPLGSNRGLDLDGSISRGGGGSLDRFDMFNRRKKADKLSTFFGAQLSTMELSSQLPMERDQHSLGGSSRRQSNDSHVLLTNGPAFTTANQLTRRERTILLKRNKKLRGILGETLPESQVAMALTRPILMGAPKLRISGHYNRRASAVSSRPPRRKREGSLYSQQDFKNGEDGGAESDASASETSDKDDDYVDEEPADNRHAGANKTKPKGKGKVTKRTSVRPRRPSSVSSSTRRSHSRTSRGLGRPLSSRSMESLLTIDSILTSAMKDLSEDDELDLEFTEESSAPVSPKSRRRRASNLSTLNSTTNGVAASTRSSSEATMSRFNRKKRMDKIQQFLGDRVPEQELWMGTVGREKTQEMLDMNLFSPTSSTGSPATFRIQPFAVSRTKSRSTGNVVAEVNAFSPGDHERHTTLERSMTDPSSKNKPDPQLDEQQLQTPNSLPARYSTANRLRQQLASPISPTTIQTTNNISGIGQLISTANVYSSPTNSGPTSPTVNCAVAASPLSYSGQHASLTLLQDDGDCTEDDEILPKLRAMSDKDQARFLKRAEKLEKYFGQFPPSSLILENGNNPSSSPIKFSEGFTLNGNGGNGNDSAPSSGRKSLTDHIGLFSNPSTRPTSSGSNDSWMERKISGSFLRNSRRGSLDVGTLKKSQQQQHQQQQLQQQNSPEQSCEDTIESLSISNSSQFNL
ncbi:hypothetical protein BGZ76_006830 [Entomortierella beljakovae]|nr:hypothetical protein BGZ76_006830 [Entomortierella beljakovae]